MPRYPRKRPAPRVITPTLKRTRFGKFGTLPLTIRPSTAEGWSDERIRLGNPVNRGRRGLTYGRNLRAELERRAVPIESVYGSVEERIVYKYLLSRRIPFDFQSSFMGGRKELGGVVADFVLHDRPLIINPLGFIWHSGVANETRDAVQNDILYGFGYQVLMIWDYEVHQETVFRRIMSQWLDSPLPPVNGGPGGLGAPAASLRL